MQAKRRTKTRQELQAKIEHLEDENEELRDRLDTVADIIAGEEEDEEGDDRENEDE